MKPRAPRGKINPFHYLFGKYLEGDKGITASESAGTAMFLYARRSGGARVGVCYITRQSRKLYLLLLGSLTMALSEARQLVYCSFGFSIGIL
jgi:hypothetical protein